MSDNSGKSILIFPIEINWKALRGRAHAAADWNAIPIQFGEHKHKALSYLRAATPYANQPNQTVPKTPRFWRLHTLARISLGIIIAFQTIILEVFNLSSAPTRLT